ncbi:MAG: FAD-binding and (Fe-S)-binding domain-containing protein [Neisseriaceae bacterium]
MNILGFKQQIGKFITNVRIIDDPILCYAYGTDASPYRMLPKLVIVVENVQEVSLIITLAVQYNIKLTFRTAGTSLSGQSSTDNVLLVLSNTSWLNYKIINDGKQISLEPGIIVAFANSLLKPYNKKIGPDPASINSCKIGGIVANNSSGMCCGITNNTYNTMSSMKIIFADGSSLDSADNPSRQKFIETHSNLISAIIALKSQICGCEELSTFIKRKFHLKNTSGYSLNAFIDYSDPIDILIHLLVGSEGTLGFISEITYNTIEDNLFRQLSLVYLDSIEDIANLAIELSNHQIEAMELLDISSLKSIQFSKKAQAYLPILKESTAAILIELASSDKKELEINLSNVRQIIGNYKVYHQISFTDDPNIIQDIWNLRKGIYPTIGANRISGSNIIIEDIAVEIKDLPELIMDLSKLFLKYSYTNTAIFGHILSGNIHFVFTPNLSEQLEIDNYNLFMQEIAYLVVTKFAGSLKAEHGCGRNMAPFVELEWGSELYKIMWKIKDLLDPHNIFNPDVILSKDKDIHLKHLKELYPVDKLVDKCTECGFCERVCPSRNLSLTPRQRIASYRYIQKFQKGKQAYVVNQYKKTYEYYGIATCATTGLCAMSCPVGIDTGQLIIQLKPKLNNYLMSVLSKHYNWFINFSKFVLKSANVMAKIVGYNRLNQITLRVHKVIPIMPVYFPTNINYKGKAEHSEFDQSIVKSKQSKKILYFPSCSTRVLDKNTKILHRIIVQMGFDVVYLEDYNNLCCGQFFSSSGYSNLANDKLLELNKIISQIECDKILIDNSSCYSNLLANNKLDKRFNSVIDFIWDNLDKIVVKKKYKRIAVHIDCSSRKTEDEKKILDILNKCAVNIVKPHSLDCCGFSGTKGFTLPELNKLALSGLKEQVENCELGVTFNQNCQIGLTFYSKIPYISLPELIINCIDNHYLINVH